MTSVWGYWIHLCEIGTCFCNIRNATEVVCSERLYLPYQLISHVWRETVEEKGSQSTIISTIKVRVNRNSTIIFSKKRFSFTFIYLQRTHQNFLNSPKKPKDFIAFSLFYSRWNKVHAKVIFSMSLKYYPVIICAKCIQECGLTYLDWCFHLIWYCN